MARIESIWLIAGSNRLGVAVTKQYDAETRACVADLARSRRAAESRPTGSRQNMRFAQFALSGAWDG